ncbi:MAG: type I-U CRISPR-associated helicase/endonuclease Cas3 [Acidimicrobiales bacterium]
MTAIAAQDFPRFFEEVWGRQPHPWQSRLAKIVCETARWPRVLDLPTGAGKTATLDIALFSLAVRPEQLPRRTVFVVDRRLIVDQVDARAAALTDALRNGVGPVTSAVGSALAELGGGQLLGRTSLRGGIAPDRSWALRPDVPWVISSTVDQFGSKLLFSGYGTSQTMRPIQAGLTGNDCLVLLDEVHLSTSFAGLLDQLDRLEDERLSNVPRRWQVVEMSATPRTQRSNPFRLDSADRDQETAPALASVLQARKRVVAKTVGGRRDEPAAALARAVPELVAAIGRARTAVVVNRVASAVAIATSCEQAGLRVHLLTGRMRPFDRDDLMTCPEMASLNPGAPDPDEPFALVATQTIEVGVDFDFDAMITEVAPTDALRQRFGRVDRRGARSARGDDAPIWVLVPSALEKPKTADPVYGEGLEHTITWLAKLGNELDGGLEGPLASAPDNTRSPSVGCPVVLPSHLDAWCQTSPEPTAKPATAQFLHGKLDTDTDVRVVWRSDIEDELDPSALLELVPPRPQESMAVPLTAVRRWLSSGPAVDVADVESAPSADQITQRIRASRLALKRGDGGLWIRIEPKDISAGDLIVVSTAAGGVTRGTWDPTSTDTVSDFGDRLEPEWPTRPVTMRLAAPALPQGISPPELDTSESASLSGSANIEAIRAWLEQALSDATDLGWWGDLAAVAKAALDSGRGRLHSANGSLVLRIDSARHGQDLDGSDETMSFTGRPTTLERHLSDVAQTAREFAERLGIPRPLIDDLALAGKLHDLGKADPRFQLRLHGTDPIAAAMSGALLAKSADRTAGPRPTGLLDETTIYPKGQRHELLSDAMIVAEPSLTAGANDLDLVRHLVASHHGRCRPLPPLQVDTHPLQVAVPGTEGATVSSELPPEVLGVETVERFWRLIRRYGWHGLAWLEAVMRLADHRASEAEDVHQ